jgi:hypothetical protein
MLQILQYVLIKSLKINMLLSGLKQSAKFLCSRLAARITFGVSSNIEVAASLVPKISAAVADCAQGLVR